jgi:predicted Zn-dependent protease with MMP-like domain
MEQQKFEEIVREGISAIPQEFLEKLDNVAITIEDEPSFEQKRQLRLRRGFLLFGLYEGVSQTRRGSHYSAVLPDKITIFKNPIEQAAQDEEDMKEIVKLTVWHEIAHHFGMNEEEVRRAEFNRRKKPHIDS